MDQKGEQVVVQIELLKPKDQFVSFKRFLLFKTWPVLRKGALIIPFVFFGFFCISLVLSRDFQ